MVDALDAAAADGMIGACGDFSHSQKFLDCVSQLETDVQSLVGEEADRISPKRYVLID